ncbi:MAG: putative membrane protein, partial [Lentimonas sp.]
MQTSSFHKHKSFWIWCSFFLVVFSYVIYRAYTLSFTHDESLSYFINHGWVDIQNTANNHWLNTWLMKVFEGVFGSSEFALRLPNVLAFIPYFLGVIWFSRQMNNGLFVFGFLSLFLLNPFLIEYFSLARGYGISLGFTMISLVCFMKLISENENGGRFIRTFFLLLFSMSGALLANFTFINFYIAALILVFWLVIQSRNIFTS